MARAALVIVYLAIVAGTWPPAIVLTRKVQEFVPMPRYFFHVDHGNFQPDSVGTELGGLEEAQAEAVVAAGEFLTELDGAFWDQAEPWRMRVTDADQRLLFTLHFSAEVPSGEATYITNPPA